MRDPRWSLVALLSALTAVSLGLTGEVTRAALLVPLAALVGAWRERRGDRAGLLLHALFQGLALVALVFFVWRLARFDLLGGAVALTFPVQAYYLVLPRTHRLLTRLQVLSFFQLVALAATTTKVFFAVSLLVYVALAPVALTLAALEAGLRERRPVPLPRGLLRAGLSAAGVGLLFGVLLFLLLPRYEAGIGQQLSARDERLSGFSDRVQLGDIGRILRSDAVVMRVGLEGRLSGTLRWRGIALDEFTGRGWRLSRVPKRTARALPSSRLIPLVAEPAGSELVRQDFVLERSKSRTVFALPQAVRLESPDFREVEVDAFGSLERWHPARSRVRYTAWSSPRAPGRAEEDPELLARCLRLPELDPRVAALAEELVAGLEDPAARARRLETHLRTSHAYTLDVQDRGLADPVSAFLLERRAGHCEYFASGMAVLCRSVGLPARIVNGFQAGTWSRFTRSFVVRQRDAHSWVEVHLPGRGWTAFDPTPPFERAPVSGLGRLKDAWRSLQIFWDDNIVGFNINHQLGARTTLGEWRDGAAEALRSPLAGRVLGGLTVLAISLAGVLAWSRRRGASRPPHAFYARALKLLARRGLVLQPGQTPGELAAEARARGGPAGEAAVELTRLYYAARFGSGRPDEERVDRLLERLAELPDLRRSA